MNKKLALLGVLFIAFSLPDDAAHANTYTEATSRAVGHIIGFHKDAKGEATDIAVETENKPAEAQETKKIEVKKKIWVVATAYSPTRWQTDDSPCITSTGYNLCEDTAKNIVAVSRDLLAKGILRYHQQIMLPDMFGDKIFYVEDTMNARFTNRIDVLHYSTEDAREFGLKRNVELQAI